MLFAFLFSPAQGVLRISKSKVSSHFYKSSVDSPIRPLAGASAHRTTPIYTPCTCSSNLAVAPRPRSAGRGPAPGPPASPPPATGSPTCPSRRKWRVSQPRQLESGDTDMLVQVPARKFPQADTATGGSVLRKTRGCLSQLTSSRLKVGGKHCTLRLGRYTTGSSTIIDVLYLRLTAI